MPTLPCQCGAPIEGAGPEELFLAFRAHADAKHSELGLLDGQIRDFIAAALRPKPPPRVAAVGKCEIRDLSPGLHDDYLRFFDGDAFADNPAWAGCYCRFYHFAGSQDDWRRCGAAENRTAMSDLIRTGAAHGLLAFADERPVGWCHAAPRASLHIDRFGPFDASESVGSIVCFVIAPQYRRHGIARRLLDTACERLAQGGLAQAEAYPARESRSDADAYHGPLSMYEGAGFLPVREAGRHLVVRRALR